MNHRPHVSTSRRSWHRHLCMALGAIGLAMALSGCIIVPPHTYYHPYRSGY